MTRQTVIAYWLIPSEREHIYFQQLVNDLASRYSAPVFEPHVTIHVGADCADAARTALIEAACKYQLLRLIPVGIDESGEFIKTLFLQFAMSLELRNASDIIRRAANDGLLYELKPHLSLLYKNLAVATRRELAASISVPLYEVTFDAIKAVRCVVPTKSGADVESWQVIAAARFSGDRV